MLALCLTACLTVGLPRVQAQEVPANDGWVTDLAGMLTGEQEAALEALMESYKSGTTHEIALLTVPDLDGRSLEDYSLEVARAWGIGGKDANNGALLFVAKDERALRIEVGRGLEGNLTDSISGRIIRDVIAPEFKRGEYYAGLRSGIEAMHAAIGGDYGLIRSSAGGQAAARGQAGCVALLFNLFILFFVVSAIARSRKRGGRTGGVLPWLILAGLGGGRGGRGGRGGGGFGGGGGGGFGGFGGGGGFSGGGASGGW